MANVIDVYISRNVLYQYIIETASMNFWNW